MAMMRIIWGLLTLAVAGAVRGQFQSTNLDIPTNAVIRLEFEKTEFLVGENVFANYVISNRGGPAFKTGTGGDYRGGTRAGRFKVSARRSDGFTAPDPEPFQWSMGGLGGGWELRSGSNWFEHVRVARYCAITEPGDYTVTVFHDLGWGPRQSNDVREVSAKVRFRLPSDKEARELVARTLSAPEDGGATWGQRWVQTPDISVLYHPIYLPALVEQAENGSTAALAGIDSVRTVTGTEALVRFMKVSKQKPAAVPTNALVAARYLERRLPKPPPRPEWETPEQAAQRKRMQSTWHPRFAEPVREFALGVLQTTNRDALLLAASELGVTGRAEDFQVVMPALERAAALTDSIWRSDHGYPEPLSVARSLAGTAFQLGRTNHDFASAETAGEALLFLQQLQRTNVTRPNHWEQTALRLMQHPSAFIRAQTIAAIPSPAPEAIGKKFVALMLDTDVVAQNRAFLACMNLQSPTVRSNALHVLANTSNRWLFNEATSLALSNGARAEAAEIIARRFADRLDGPGSEMPHEATMALFRITSGGYVSGGFRQRPEANEIVALQKHWIEFVAAHRSDLAAGRTFKPGDGSGLDALLSSGWQFYPQHQ